MSARQERLELLVLTAVVVLTALGLGIAVFVQQRDDAGAPSGDRASAATPSASPTSSPTAGADPSPSATPVDDAVQVHGAAYVNPCRVLPRDDIIDIYGPFSTEGFVRQQYLDRAPTAREERAAARLAYGGLTSSCVSVLGDAPGHTVEVVLTQFPSEERLAKRWAALREGSRADRVRPGRIVSGTDDRMLLLVDRRSFVTRGETVLAEVRFATANDALRGRPLSTREIRAQLSQMRRAQAIVAPRLDDGSATEGPQSVNAGLGAAVAGTAYVSPCALFSATDLEALGGARGSAVVIDTSYRRDDRWTDAPVATCERSGTRAGRSTFAVFEVRLARDDEGAQQVQAKHLDGRYPARTRISKVSTAAGPAYVVDVGGTEDLPWKRRAMHLVVGAYELQLTAVRDVGKGQESGRAVTDEQLGAALSAAAARLVP